MLSVATSTSGGMAEVLVRNGGAVIDPEQVQALTEPFRRLSRASGGFGLGLSIVRSVAEVHGGTVELVGSRRGWAGGPRTGAVGAGWEPV